MFSGSNGGFFTSAAPLAVSAAFLAALISSLTSHAFRSDDWVPAGELIEKKIISRGIKAFQQSLADSPSQSIASADAGTNKANQDRLASIFKQAEAELDFAESRSNSLPTSYNACCRLSVTRYVEHSG